MSTAVTLVAGTMPPGWCYSTAQDLLETLVNAITAYLAGTSNTFNFGSTTPNADQRDRPWLRTDINYNPERWYTWSNQYSLWLALHPVKPGQILMTSDDISAAGFFDSYDGGSAGAVTATSGPMWEKYSAMDNRVPMAPGLWSDGVTTLALGGTAGSQKHTLTALELPPHSHGKGRDYDNVNPAGLVPSNVRLYSGANFSGVDNPNVPPDGGNTNNPFDIIPPVCAVNFLRRTARIYYRAV
jgi:hypothetical protein